MGTYDTRGGSPRHDPMMNYDPPGDDCKDPEEFGWCDECGDSMHLSDLRRIGSLEICERCTAKESR